MRHGFFAGALVLAITIPTAGFAQEATLPKTPCAQGPSRTVGGPAREPGLAFPPTANVRNGSMAVVGFGAEGGGLLIVPWPAAGDVCARWKADAVSLVMGRMDVFNLLAALAIGALSTWKVVMGLRDGEASYRVLFRFPRTDRPASTGRR